MRRLGDRAIFLVLPLLAALALPVMTLPTWITLTAAGLAMGMMLFLMAAGLTLVFGLMDVLNFAHGAFITLGAFLAVSVFVRLGGWVGADSLGLNLLALGAALASAAIVGGAAGIGVRADHHPPRLWFASATNPHHRRWADRRRPGDDRGLGRRAAGDRQARRAARQPHRRRRRDRDLPPGRRRASGSRSMRPCTWC